MKIKHFYVGNRVHGYCLLKYVSLTAAQHSVVQYIWLLTFDSTENSTEKEGVRSGAYDGLQENSTEG
jgi:hypothetical protein